MRRYFEGTRNESEYDEEQNAQAFSEGHKFIDEEGAELSASTRKEESQVERRGLVQLRSAKRTAHVEGSVGGAMKYRIFAWVVVVCAAAATFGTVPAEARAKTGRVEGRVTVDGKPVTRFNINLTVKKPNPKAKSTRTDSDGRFVFKSVAPGRDYELVTALAVKPPEGGPRPNCKVSGATMGFSQIQPAGFTITALTSGTFRVKAGQKVTRNIESDCQPDAEIVTPTTLGGGAK